MKELELKLKELEEAKKSCESCIEKVDEEIRELIKEDKDYLSKEVMNFENRQSLKEIERKITIINNAMDILEGVE